MSRVVFLAEARAEALETFRWYYEEQRSGLGAVFRRELDDAIKRIRSAPLAYPPLYRDVRRVLVERFPYAVFYRILPAAIVVVGVIHRRRHPREWKRRA
ncbi:type II toxin-antitoxin system RelE/ParE family toxin [Sorangium sp. So ce381]|uniref:type II toxin-antitoxin system RelE/ParE family toxin n=1 Tax=Sorangium sp. So ce381 TaxID=3133307 RepID=UPI003F5C4E06